ncbi:hypothetical protein HYW58_03225 [Candidatus Kaiserbacteria bacterium]|nr:hypothetical protein [Candidatus Kaiserbacteria bacterium]
MDLLFWGLTFRIIGEVILGLAVIGVHWRIVKEHRIDGKVLKDIRRERNLAIIAIILMAVGYALELTFYEFL